MPRPDPGTFGDGSRHVYALVFGCDGNRSNTRRLVFGDAEDFSYFMGGYFFIKVVPTTGLLPANMSQIYSVPGRTALLNGYDDQTDIALAFRTPREIDYDYRNRAQQRRLIPFDHTLTPTAKANLGPLVWLNPRWQHPSFVAGCRAAKDRFSA